MVPSAPPMISTDVLWNSRAKKNQSVILRGRAIQTIFFCPQFLIAKVTLMPHFYILPTGCLVVMKLFGKSQLFTTKFRLLHIKTRLLQFNNWVELHQSPSMKSILSVQQEIHPSPWSQYLVNAQIARDHCFISKEPLRPSSKDQSATNECDHQYEHYQISKGCNKCHANIWFH